MSNKIKAPFISTSFSENGQELHSRFGNILNTKAKKRGTALLVAVIGAAIAGTACVGFAMPDSRGNAQMQNDSTLRTKYENNSYTGKMTLALADAEAYNAKNSVVTYTGGNIPTFSALYTDRDGSSYTVTMDEYVRKFGSGTQLEGYFTVAKDGSVIKEHILGYLSSLPDCAYFSGGESRVKLTGCDWVYIMQFDGKASNEDLGISPYGTLADLVTSNPKKLIIGESTASAAEDGKIISSPSGGSRHLIQWNDRLSQAYIHTSVDLPDGRHASIQLGSLCEGVPSSVIDTAAGTLRGEFEIAIYSKKLFDAAEGLEMKDSFTGTAYGLNGKAGDIFRIVSDDGKYDFNMNIYE